MDSVPDRLYWVKGYRLLMRQAERFLPLPKVNPSVYQVVSLFLSFAVWRVEGEVAVFVVIFLILISDWYDGATARKYGLLCREGYLIDVVVDRISEVVIFFHLLGSGWGEGLFLLALFNVFLSFYSIRFGKHLILPLRFGYLVYLGIKIWIF